MRVWPSDSPTCRRVARSIPPRTSARCSSASWARPARATWSSSAPKLTSNARLMKLITATDSRAALWGAGEMSPDVGAGLVRAAGGAIKQPAQAIYGFVNSDSGLAVELALEMAGADDAKALEA